MADNVTLHQWDEQSAFTTRSWFVKNVDGASPRSPIRKIENNIPLFTFELISIVIGLPLNLNVVWTILRHKVLPRHIFVLGIVFSSLTAFAKSTIEVIHYFVPSNITCYAYVSLMGLPDSFLLMATFLSLIDRYIALQHPLWHLSKVTCKMAVCAIIIGFILVTGICRFVYFAQIVPFQCSTPILERQISSSVLMVLFILCLIARVAVYLQTRKNLRQNELEIGGGRWTAFSCTTSLCCCAFFQQNHPPNDSPAVADGDVGNNAPDRHIFRLELEHPRLSEETVNRLEMEATKVLVAGVTSLLVLSFPLVAFSLTMFSCRMLFDSGGYCNRFVWLGGYVHQFAQVHGIYNSIVYMAWYK